MTRPAPAAFLSYAHADDRDGDITRLVGRLASEVGAYIGEEFAVFQDKQDLGWGQAWRRRVEESLDATTFLIAVLSPSFFRSAECRLEVERFLERERALGRDDLLLPLYFIDYGPLERHGGDEGDAVLAAMAARQRVDWRDLRLEPLESPTVRRRLATLAAQVRDSLAAPGSPSVTAASESARPAAAVEGPRRGQRVLDVDAFGRGGAFTTISEAIRSAAPGDRIVVKRGVYRESVVVDRSIEIVGDGPSPAAVLEARDAEVVHFQSAGGRLENLVVRQLGAGQHCGVFVDAGYVEVERCDVTSATGSCIAVIGASAMITGCSLHDSAGNAIYVSDDGGGTIEDNEIYGNALPCIFVTTGAAPIVRNNRIHDSASNGIRLVDNGGGTIEGNDIYGHAWPGIDIASRSAAIVRRNRIHDCAEAGVVVEDGSGGVIEDNDVYGNAMAGIVVADGSTPIVRNNRIHDGARNGILVRDEGGGTIEGNDIDGNAYTGVAIETGASPVVRGNRIHDGKEGGVWVYSNGGGTIEGNDIYGNAYAGVTIQTGAAPTVRRNRVHDGAAAGIVVEQDGGGAIEENDIYGNAFSGIEIRSGAAPIVRNNRIHDGAQHGILIHDGGRGTIEDNDVYGNALGDIEIHPDASPTVLNNRTSGGA
jgi:F-box protein 11